MINKYFKFIAGVILLTSCIFSVRAQTPGGVNNSNYTWAAWLTSDSYSDGTWRNLAAGTKSVGNFAGAQIAPVKGNLDGYNFHPAVMFDKSSNSAAPNQLYSQLPLNVAASENLTMIFVLQRKTMDNYDFLLGLTNVDNYNSLSWRTNSNNNLTFRWGGGGATGNIEAVQSGILTVDNPNTAAANGLHVYKNGIQTAYQSYQWNGTTYAGNGQATIGGGRNDRAWYGYQGNLQEVILLKKSGNGHINPVDLQKIHSYLAVKYGLTLNNTNYINSNGDIVWNTTANAGYNNQVFGIGRDDASGLYQKQSQSESNKAFAIYTGNTLTELNSRNTGTLLDKQYVMFGSDGASSIQRLTGIKAGDQYANAALGSSAGFNFQSNSYKVQISGASPSMKVNMQAPSNDFLYVLVSSDAGFTPAKTYIYPIDRRIAQNVTVDGTYRYIKFIGFSPGPGGVSTNLQLWLRADDDASLTINNLSSTDTKFTGYPDPVSDPDNVPGVSVWADQIRGKSYSYTAGAQVAAHLMPVYKPNSSEMNYHPAVRFWGTNSNGAYLSNPSGILNTATPEGGQHTMYCLVNNNFGKNSWIYPFIFSQNIGSSATTIGGGMPYPGYGVNQVNNGIVARFRTSGTECDGMNSNMFTPGATSMLGFSTNTNNSGANNRINFRFNAVADNSTNLFSWNNVDFTHASLVGGGYAYNRIMQGVLSEVIFFDKALTEDETQLLESYLALKYGITLYPSNNAATKRFSYMLSDGTVIWNGNTVGTSFAKFYNNVAAVIRDDAARLYNRHSHSTNVGSLLHVGVAGTELSDNDSRLGDLNNMEAVVFGSDGASGNKAITGANTCGDFTNIFNRKWLIHKRTQNDRPISLLIGAQNNWYQQIGGTDPADAAYYAVLNPNYDLYMIVADSPENIDKGIYKAIILMSYINGEYQCNYAFSKNDTYITFGYKVNNKGCEGDREAVFSGSKKFDWTQWTPKTNTVTNPATINVTNPVDLSDNIVVTKTSVTYPASVITTKGYPRAINAPARGSLEVQRRGDHKDVVIAVTFNHPVIPEFSISGLDTRGSCFEEVEIYGSCSGNTVLPRLSYASAQKNATYTINKNIATVMERGIVSSSNKNGMVNIKFQGGVTSVTIKYRTKGVVSESTQNINISPITLRGIPPVPPVNEDALSFVMQVAERDITTCDPVEYSFYIQNTNCETKTVNFNDILPDKMNWKIDSFVLDALSENLNPSFNPQIMGNGGELQINGLIVSGSSTLVLTATAALAEDAPTGEYGNQATITYLLNDNSPQMLQSLDRETLEPITNFFATKQQPQAKVGMTATFDPQTYKADSKINVVYTITNPNEDIPGSYLNTYFNDEFTYIANSLQIKQDSGEPVPAVTVTKATTDPVSPLTIAGSSDGTQGFTLRKGITVITFKLQAPAMANLLDELDDNGKPTGKKADLEIIYELSSEANDPCMFAALDNLDGSALIPYKDKTGKTHIISNRNVTTKIIR